MKILLFLPNLGGGGTERVVVNLSREFTRRGIDVRMVTLEDTMELDVDPASVVCLGVPKSSVLLARPLYWYGCIRELIRVIKQEEPQAVMSLMTGPNHMACVARLFCRGPRLILSERVVVSANFRGWNWRLVKAGIGLVYRVADEVIVNSEPSARDLKMLGVTCRTTVIHNPVDLDEIRRLSVLPLGELETVFRRPVICTAGRLEEQKGYPYLLRAFKLIDADVHLLVLGKGSRERELRQLAEELGIESRVFFAGFQPNPYNLIQRSSVFVLPSLWEGMPNVVIESLAVGTRVVAADSAGGVREVLDHGKFGVIVPTRDPDALAQGLREVLDGTRRFEKTDLTGRAADFSLEKIGSKYLDVILDRAGNDA